LDSGIDYFSDLSPAQNSDLKWLHGKLIASGEVSRDGADAKIAELAENLQRNTGASASVARVTLDEVAAKLDLLQSSVDAIASKLDRV
jgi:hypothetical protein